MKLALVLHSYVIMTPRSPYGSRPGGQIRLSEKGSSISILVKLRAVKRCLDSCGTSTLVAEHAFRDTAGSEANALFESAFISESEASRIEIVLILEVIALRLRSSKTSWKSLHRPFWRRDCKHPGSHNLFVCVCVVSSSH
eukprot:2911506-Amphidinium_carterae.1